MKNKSEPKKKTLLETINCLTLYEGLGRYVDRIINNTNMKNDYITILKNILNLKK